MAPPVLADFNGGAIPSTLVNQWIKAIQYALYTNPQGIVGWAERITGSSTTTTEVGVLQLNNIPITLGRAYGVTASPLALTSTVANDIVRGLFRVSTAGPAGTGSTALDLIQASVASTVNSPLLGMSALYIPAASGTLSVLLSVARQSGTGSVSIGAGTPNPVDLWVVDLGLAPANTGVLI